MKALLAKWQAAWPEALAAWSPFTRLSEPGWLLTEADEGRDGLVGSFAAIRMNDHRILISLRQVKEFGLEEYGTEILAHEIGHHVLCPGNLLEAGRSLVIAHRALPTVESAAPMIVNLWEDLLINDRLVRVHQQRHFEIYEKLNARELPKSKLWSLYMRAYELLWGLKPGRLSSGRLKAAEEGDAHLVARMVRVYGGDWLEGVGGFAALCLPYLLENKNDSLSKNYAALFDTDSMGEGCDVPMGVLEVGAYEIVHPSQDPNITGIGVAEAEEKEACESEEPGRDSPGGAGQSLEPFLFGQILEALGLKLDKHDAAVKFYREKALPHLIPFPTQEAEQSKEPLMEGLEPWDVGNPMEEVDWMQSLMISPVPIPGMTTVRRTWGLMGGTEREREPLDLDLYVDCSGSIPNPQTRFSFLALAGAIVVLSALRTGARVQATLWSGARQFDTTPGFISDETAILRVLTGYLGGGTAFPNHILVDTYQGRREQDRPVHILVLSDDGIVTMQNRDNKGTDGLAIARMALEKAGGGATMVLNLWNEKFLKNAFSQTCREMGWEIYLIKGWDGLLDFAKDFSRRKYGSLDRKARA